jgi:hypothetical protein
MQVNLTPKFRSPTPTGRCGAADASFTIVISGASTFSSSPPPAPVVNFDVEGVLLQVRRLARLQSTPTCQWPPCQRTSFADRAGCRPQPPVAIDRSFELDGRSGLERVRAGKPQARSLTSGHDRFVTIEGNRIMTVAAGGVGGLGVDHERSCFLYVSRVVPLGEPLDKRGDQARRSGGPVLVLVEARQARSGPQLPGSSPLFPRD